MGKQETMAVKRLGRGIISLAISAGVAYFTGKPYLIALAPIINALAKWLRGRFNLPFSPV